MGGPRRMNYLRTIKGLTEKQYKEFLERKERNRKFYADVGRGVYLLPIIIDSDLIARDNHADDLIGWSNRFEKETELQIKGKRRNKPKKLLIER